MTTKILSTEEKVQILSTLTTKDDAGQHFTERYDGYDLDALEAEGLIEVIRPVHKATGLSYSDEYWTVEVTETGVELVQVNS